MRDPPSFNPLPPNQPLHPIDEEGFRKTSNNEIAIDPEEGSPSVKKANTGSAGALSTRSKIIQALKMSSSIETSSEQSGLKKDISSSSDL